MQIAYNKSSWVFRFRIPILALLLLASLADPLTAKPSPKRYDANCAAPAPQQGHGGYGRRQRSPRLGKNALALLQKVRRWGRKHGLRLRLDPALTAAALCLVRIDKDPNQAQAKNAAHNAGWYDGELTTLQLQDSSFPALQQNLARSLRQEIAIPEGDQVGLALQKSDKEYRAWVLISKRRVWLQPFSPVLRQSPMASPTQKSPTWSLRGRHRSQKSLQKSSKKADAKGCHLSWLLQDAQGRTQSKAIACGQDGRFRAAIPIPKTPGQARLQLVQQGLQGPRIAALVPLQVISHGFPQKADKAHTKSIHTETLSQTLSNPAPKRQDPNHQAERLAEWILASRHAEGLPRASRMPALDKVAQEYAQQMASQGFFGHRAPDQKTLSDRLKAAQIPFARAYENLAMAPSAEAAAAQWQTSPSHRKNLWIPDARWMGFGVVPLNDALMIVFIAVQPPDSGTQTQLKQRLWQLLSQKRSDAGLPALVLDPALDPLAQAHADAYAISKSHASRLGNGALQTLVDKALVQTHADKIYADEFLTASLDMGTRSKHLMAPNICCIGIGVAPSQKGTQAAMPPLSPASPLWITLLYARALPSSSAP